MSLDADHLLRVEQPSTPPVSHAASAAALDVIAGNVGPYTHIGGKR